MSNSYYQAGGMPNPAYHGSTEKSRQDAVVVPMTGTNAHSGVILDSPKWSWCSTGWACFTSCCCPVSTWCGFLGLLCSILSYTDHKSGDYDRSKYKRRWAWCCTVFGLIFSILIIVGLILIFVVFADRIAKAGCNGYRATSSADVWAAFCKWRGFSPYN